MTLAKIQEEKRECFELSEQNSRNIIKLQESRELAAIAIKQQSFLQQIIDNRQQELKDREQTQFRLEAQERTRSTLESKQER